KSKFNIPISLIYFKCKMFQNCIFNATFSRIQDKILYTPGPLLIYDIFPDATFLLAYARICSLIEMYYFFCNFF
ncbi:hypothetical protein H4684_002927, partial [Desulfomicrobium macestii]|nr:hypothetical protein [Desulfomicrobium macestii]